ncbi:hypothetical protein Pcinc_006035 [Petrolisthes cinctipes]|uniref:Uncharacterized protein n=1 Tax=Petrolisthes cinctipes TaxID=88211 RepID=A0AAE1KYF3_PETCI|nr:hypothetical protein Pcinc_006035 [Petrolisthes cinctipes]
MSPWASPCLLIPKPDGSFRFCTDYRKVNQVTVQDSYPLPLIDDIIDEIGQSPFITTIDLLKGYYQIPLTPRAKKVSAFVTPFGLYQYKVLSFGLSNAPATFQRMINFIIQDLEVGQGVVRPKSANVEAILSFPTPSTRKELLRFLGMAGYYRRFCSNFSTFAAPLTDLTSSSVPFQWNDVCNQSFARLKTLLASHPVVHAPDFSQPFHLQIDASGVGVGAVLLQPDPVSGILHPVAYHSAKLKKHQIGYSTIEKETLALISALQKLQCYLRHAQHTTLVFSDHNPLALLNSMKNNNHRILRWALWTQPYNIVVKHIKGVDNIIADSLSRSPISDPEDTSPLS